MRLAWQMREPRWRKLLAQLTREEFEEWLVAYHELRLDGSTPAALVAATIHNELGAVNAYFGTEFEAHTTEDHLPVVEYVLRSSQEAKQPDRPDQPDWEAMAARAWGV